MKTGTLEKVALGGYVSDYTCLCGGQIRLQGFHIDGTKPDLILECEDCGRVVETTKEGDGLKKVV